MERYFLAINGTEISPPQDFAVTLHTMDADSSGRNANGRMVRDIIAQKVKLECTWGALNPTQAQTILRLIRSPFFTISYIDPEGGAMTTKTFYAGDRSAPSYSWNPRFRRMAWEGLRVNFIER